MGDKNPNKAKKKKKVVEKVVVQAATVSEAVAANKPVKTQGKR